MTTMGNNQTAQIERQRNGEVPGFIGSDESVEAFAERETQRARDEAERAATVRPDADLAQGDAVSAALGEALANLNKEKDHR